MNTEFELRILKKMFLVFLCSHSIALLIFLSRNGFCNEYYFKPLNNYLKQNLVLVHFSGPEREGLFY